MRAVVTGGGGFLGSAVVAMLLEEGYSVSSFSRKEYAKLKAQGVPCRTGDLADRAAVEAALEHAEVVFHVAAKAGIWGHYREYYAANVVGTRNVIAACRGNGVRKLVYTSTPSVAFSGLNHYGTTKAEAERLVLAANGPDLATVALRPHAIWGPGDNQILPRLVERHRANRLRIVGRGDNLVDTTYVENAARAHLEAARRLYPGSALAGSAYFIAQGDPRPIRRVLNDFLSAAGLTPITKSVPVPVAYGAAWLLENWYRLFGVKGEPPLTRYFVLQFAREHCFDLTPARRDLGYQPEVSFEEGLEKLRSWVSAGQVEI